MSDNSVIGVGIVGAGFRGGITLGSRIAETTGETGFRVVALCDRKPDRLCEIAAHLVGKFREQGVEIAPSLYEDHEALIADPTVDIVMVTTPQCAHRDPAVAALRSGKKVYLDKPIAHNLEDSIAIVEEEARTKSPLLLGFTRRYEAPWRRAFALLQEGVIGDLHMIQLRAIMPQVIYFHRWHRRRKWSGGALNDSSSHHFDVLNWFAGARPARLSAFGGRRVFHPDPNAPARCLECERDCPYRVKATPGQLINQDRPEGAPDSWTKAAEEFDRVDNCVYLPGADIKDHAAAQIQYENGVVGSLFVSFFGPRAPDQETLELVGTKGRITLYRRDGKLDVITNYGGRQETVDCRNEDFHSSHHGADMELIREMRRFYDGAPPVVSGFNGFEATRMVMATHQAIDDGGVTIDMKDFPDADV